MLDGVDIQATVNQRFIYNQVTSITVYIKVPKYGDTFKGEPVSQYRRKARNVSGYYPK